VVHRTINRSRSRRHPGVKNVKEVQRHDLTRISNIDCADARGFAPCASNPPTARRVSHRFLFNDLGTPLSWRPEVVHFSNWLVASGDFTGAERSGGSE